MLTLCEKFHIIAGPADSGRRAVLVATASAKPRFRVGSWKHGAGVDPMSQIFHRYTNIYSRLSILAARRYSLACSGGVVALLNLSGYNTNQDVVRRAADSVQPRPSRRRHGHRLPLLPHLGRRVGVREHSADEDLHELPLADLDRRADSGAGPRELPRQHAAPMDPRPRSAGLRLLQPQHPREARASAAPPATVGSTRCR